MKRSGIAAAAALAMAGITGAAHAQGKISGAEAHLCSRQAERRGPASIRRTFPRSS